MRKKRQLVVVVSRRMRSFGSCLTVLAAGVRGNAGGRRRRREDKKYVSF